MRIRPFCCVVDVFMNAIYKLLLYCFAGKFFRAVWEHFARSGWDMPAFPSRMLKTAFSRYCASQKERTTKWLKRETGFDASRFRITKVRKPALLESEYDSELHWLDGLYKMRPFAFVCVMDCSETELMLSIWFSTVIPGYTPPTRMVQAGGAGTGSKRKNTEAPATLVAKRKSKLFGCRLVAMFF